MSSPNEPGQPGPGEAAGNGSGTVDRSGGVGWTGPAPRLTDSGEVPPWQRGTGRTQQSGPSRPKPTTEPAPRTQTSSPGLDSRTSRYVTGTAAPAALQASEAEAPAAGRAEVARTNEYASELPDLSGPIPRAPQQRRAGSDRAETATAAAPRTSPQGRVQVAGRAKGGPVRASMQIRRIDPWSTLKVSLLLSVALFFVWMIAVAFLYLVLGGMGVWSKLNSNVGDLLTSTGGSGGELVSSGTIFGGALLIGLVNIVLLTAMATIGAFIYNLTTDIVGGIEVTLADRD